MGPVRERMYVSTITSMERIPKNKLILQFDPLNTWILRFESKYERDQWTKKIQDAIELSTWMKQYRVGDVVMQTDGSTIVQAFNSNRKEDVEDPPSHVIKVMATDTKKTRLRARNELRVYHHMTTHPNVLTISDSIRQTERAYVVLDYCAGGDLFDYLSHHGAMEETDAKTLFYYIIQAVAHVHKQGIIHLDIKPENLFFSSALKDASSIQLADFGSAQMVHDLYSPSLPSISCTIGYAAPEVLEHGMISYAADVFSLGAVLYTILCGYAPFHTLEQESIVEKTLHGDFSIETQEWQYLSPSAKELIGGMLEVQPNVRLSLEEVLNHPWLQSVTKSLL